MPFVMPFLTYIGVGLVAVVFIVILLGNMGNSKASRLQLRYDMHGY
jgi:ABC-type transport system involved in cytochrome bd biosynthesis fused ATPase/permease subunit